MPMSADETDIQQRRNGDLPAPTHPAADQTARDAVGS